MSVWDFIISAALNVGAEIIRTLWYLGIFFAAICILVWAACQIIEKIYECKRALYLAHFLAEEEVPASQQSPLHIV